VCAPPLILRESDLSNALSHLEGTALVAEQISEGFGRKVKNSIYDGAGGGLTWAT
jgi:hypothetical protein